MLIIAAQEEPATSLSGTQIWHQYAIMGRDFINRHFVRRTP